MLSDYRFSRQQSDDPRRENLYRGLSRLCISLARHTQPCIGALRFDNNGIVHLSQPPVLCGNAILESETGLVALNRTYSSTDRFVYDMLGFRDRVLLAQPNAANDEDDCRLQMAHIVLVRALLPQLVDPDTPFVFQFTDLHASNLFVDEAWNITAVIDLEFICALPASMLSVPFWLAGDNLDDIVSEDHARVHDAFMEVFRSEELRLGRTDTLSHIIQQSWKSGAFWFYHCLTSINALPSIVEDQFYTMYGFQPSSKELRTFTKWLSMFWSRSSDFVAKKVADKQAYVDELRNHFEADPGN